MVNAFVDHPEALAAYCGIWIRDAIGHSDFVLLRDFDRRSGTSLTSTSSRIGGASTTQSVAFGRIFQYRWSGT